MKKRKNCPAGSLNESSEEIPQSDKKLCLKKHSLKTCSYIVILVVMGLIAAFTISLWIADLFIHLVPRESNIDLFDAVGIVSQVITAIITCVISILGISFSIQDYVKFETKIKDLLTLRVDKHFSFLSAVLISFSLVICNLLALVFKWYFICFGSAIISLVLCFYILIIETPYLHAQEKTLQKILKNYLFVHSSDVTLAEPFTTAVTALIKRDGLINTYYTLSNHSSKNCSYNRRLLDILLNIQEDIARNVQYFDDKLEVERVTHKVLDTVINIISGDFDLSEILEDDFVNCDNQIIRTMYFLSKKSNPCYQSVAKAVAQLICFSQRNTRSKLYELFKHRILLSMVAIPIHNREYSVIREIKAQYSQLYLSLNEKSDSTLMFALISMFLYYMIVIEQDVSDEWKLELKNEIEFSGVINNTKVESWKMLFACLAEFFQIDCEKFMKTFKENRSRMEYMIFSGGMHECRFYDDCGLKWYLTHYMNSYHFLNPVDFVNEFSYVTNSSALRFYFKEFCKQCYSNGEFKPTQEMIQMVNFWGNSNNNFHAFAISKNGSDSFKQFYHQIVIEDEERLNSNAPTTVATDYIPQLKQRIEESLLSEWGFDKNLELPSTPNKSLNILILQSAKTEETVEMLSSSLPNRIFFEIRNMCRQNITSIPIVNQEMDEELLQQLLDSEIEVMVRDVSYYDCFIKNDVLKTRYQNLCNHVSSIKGHVFKPALIAKNGFRFNVSIDLMEKYELTDQQFNDLIEQYRRSDGQYFYEGVFMNRDEVSRCLKNKYHLLVMEIRLAVESKESGIYEFEFKLGKFRE